MCRSYAQIGVIMSSAGYLGYFTAFMHYGWKPWDLWQLRVKWDDPDLILKDSFGAEWVSVIGGIVGATNVTHMSDWTELRGQTGDANYRTEFVLHMHCRLSVDGCDRL